MKTTKYFMAEATYSQIRVALDNVIKQKDDFINQNKSIIGKIDNEDIIITDIHTSKIVMIIKLTYYPK